MRLATSSTDHVAEQRAVAAFDSLRTALSRPLLETRPQPEARSQPEPWPEPEPAPPPAEPKLQQAPTDKPGDTAVAMRLASEAIAAATRSAESELRRMRELVDESEARARTAEERAREAERLLAEIRDQILGKYPEQRAA
jgi:hypothetical protein